MCIDCQRVMQKMRRGYCITCYTSHQAADDFPPRPCGDCGEPVPFQRGQRMTIASYCDGCRERHISVLRRLRYAHTRDSDPAVHAARAAAQTAARGRWAQSPSGRLLEYASSYRQHTGITINWPQMAALMEAQNHRCAICRKPIEFSPGRGTVANAHLDHCHATKRIRGWLCSPCNRALGMLKDDPAVLRSAADYLERCVNLPEGAVGLALPTQD